MSAASRLLLGLGTSSAGTCANEPLPPVFVDVGGTGASVAEGSAETTSSRAVIATEIGSRAATSTDPARGVQLTSLADVEMQRAKWAWVDRVLLGGVTLIAGIPGYGKSTLAVHLAARLTRGQLDGDLRGKPIDVVIASAEDALAFVLRPRFTAAGADLARVHSIAVHRDDAEVGIQIPDDLDGSARCCRRAGRSCS